MHIWTSFADTADRSSSPDTGTLRRKCRCHCFGMEVYIVPDRVAPPQTRSCLWSIHHCCRTSPGLKRPVRNYSQLGRILCNDHCGIQTEHWTAVGGLNIFRRLLESVLRLRKSCPDFCWRFYFNSSDTLHSFFFYNYPWPPMPKKPKVLVSSPPAAWDVFIPP